MQLLERELLFLRDRVAPADDEHGHGVYVRVRDGGHDVGDAGAGRDHRHADLARHSRPAIGHVAGCLLVARVDDANVVFQAGLEYRVDVAAVEREDLLDALLLQHPDDHFAAVNLHCRIPPRPDAK